jgi:hypothetical protein
MPIVTIRDGTQSAPVELTGVSEHNQGLLMARFEGRVYVASVWKNPSIVNEVDAVLEEHAVGVTLFSLLKYSDSVTIQGEQFENIEDGFQLRVHVLNPFPRSQAYAFVQTLRFFVLKEVNAASF